MSADSAEDRRLLALAAVFLPDRAAELLDRLAGANTALRERAARAATAPRRDRLLALAAALIEPEPEPLLAEAIEALASGERPVTAAHLRGLLGKGGPRAQTGAIHPALRRLVRERLEHLRAALQPFDRDTDAGGSSQSLPPAVPPRHEP